LSIVELQHQSAKTVLRTQSKEKLPKGHSYPIGAEGLSAALEGIPQISTITISFWYKDEFWASSYNKKLKEDGEIAVLRAEYGAPFYEWRIHVSSVPSTAKQRVAEAIHHKVLPALKASYESLSKASPDSVHQSFIAKVSIRSGHVQISC
jgi:hypothetical protein